ncbi:MAG: AraC family transcriptional regulator [Candidatus Curtissbacteria bacterium]
MRVEPLHFQVPKLNEETLRVESWNLNYFFDPIHFHEEFQITLILEGKGSVFVADNVVPFKEDEIYLFGKNLPHVFKSDKTHYENGAEGHSRAISVFFNQDVIKNSLSSIPEAYAIQRLIDFSIYGIKVSSNHTPAVRKSLIALTKKKSFEKVVVFLNMLRNISEDNNLNFISSTGIPIHTVVKNIPSITKVFDYIRTNYQEKITLEQIAELVNMSPTAFCRFFKHKTQKTFSRFLIEVRIGNACKLLVQDDSNTAECCYSSGFSNISNFHRHFKSVTRMTPSQYRNKILGKNA